MLTAEDLAGALYDAGAYADADADADFDAAPHTIHKTCTGTWRCRRTGKEGSSSLLGHDWTRQS